MSARSSPEPVPASTIGGGVSADAIDAMDETDESEVEFLYTPSPSILCPVLEIEPFCPLCRSRIKIEDLHPNLALSGLISELLVYCSNKKYGCPQIVRQDALHGHVLYCSYAPSICPNKTLGCPYKGTMRDAKDHLQNCVYERFKGYIDSTNKRFEKLEALLADQAREIEKLQWIIRAGKGAMHSSETGLTCKALPTTPVGKDATHSADVSASGSSSSGTKRTIISTFPHDEITCHRTIASHPCGVTSVAVNQDRVFAGAHDGSTKVFDINTGQLLKDLKGHTMSVWGLAVMPSGDRYFSAGSDGAIKVWDWLMEDQDSCLVRSIPDHNAKVYGLVVYDGRLYSASSDKTVKVWDTETLECLATFHGHTGGVNSLAALTEASAPQLVTGSSDKTIKLWDVATGTCLKTVRRGTSEVLDVAVGDGMLFGSTYDAVIHVYDLNETRELGTLSGHNWEVWQLEYGQGHLFSASFDHTIKRWDPRRFQCDLTLKGHKSFVHGMALADHYLVTGCADRTIKIWR
ncbi:E3 ubiquitin-protein ligase traf7 [Mortierella claussenii]|nr:E3 ubiquitin-protein ligase traf7 [Mortierella claussenii]